MTELQKDSFEEDMENRINAKRKLGEEWIPTWSKYQHEMRGKYDSKRIV